MLQKSRSLEESLLLLTEQQEPLTFQEILSFFRGKGRLLAVLIVALPSCLPIHIPGFATFFGLLIAFLGLRIAFGRRMWLPKTLLTKSIPASKIRKIAQKSLHLMRKMKRWTYPRLQFLCHHALTELVNGCIFIILGLLLALPLPIPFSHLVAAFPILFISFGLVKDDGVFVLLGYAMFILACFFFFIVGEEIRAIIR